MKFNFPIIFLRSLILISQVTVACQYDWAKPGLLGKNLTELDKTVLRKVADYVPDVMEHKQVVKKKSYRAALAGGTVTGLCAGAYIVRNALKKSSLFDWKTAFKILGCGGLGYLSSALLYTILRSVIGRSKRLSYERQLADLIAETQKNLKDQKNVKDKHPLLGNFYRTKRELAQTLNVTEPENSQFFYMKLDDKFAELSEKSNSTATKKTESEGLLSSTITKKMHCKGLRICLARDWILITCLSFSTFTIQRFRPFFSQATRCF